MNAWLKWLTITAGAIAASALTIATAGLAPVVFLKVAAVAGGVGTLTGAAMRSPFRALQSPPPHTEKEPTP